MISPSTKSASGKTSGRPNISLGKVGALEEWLLRQRSERVGETVAEVEAGGVASLAEPSPRLPSNVPQLGVDRNNLNPCLVQPQVDSPPPRAPRRASITIAVSKRVAAEIMAPDGRLCVPRRTGFGFVEGDRHN